MPSPKRAARGVIPFLSAVALSGAVFSGGTTALADPRGGDHSRHVLLISVDGLHEFDRAQWVAEHPDSVLARIGRDGSIYTHASTSTPSDSFPGLLAQVTGGTPKTTGVFYDDSYSRVLWAPDTNCAGAPGAETTYAENLDTTVSGGLIPLFPKPPIDPANLPLGMVSGTCSPIFPHSFLETNTIFEVAHASGLYTAWSDKHPAYEIVRGPSNTGADDLFTPEINTTQIPDPTTVGVKATDDYDQLKVNAILNEIDGKTSDGTQQRPVPAIFGMNFQSVSVGQKLVDPILSCTRNPTSTCDPAYVPGGYKPGTLKFTPQMEQAMGYVDGALGSMLDELRQRGLLQTTDVIVSAKHGQSPIDPAKLAKIGDPIGTLLNGANINVGENTEDDISVIWLRDQSQTNAAVQVLTADKNGANTAHIQTIISGDALAARFGDPHHNSRTPDIIVQPIPGTIYTTSKAKVAEHGGFSEDDTHVALIVLRGERDDQRGNPGAHGEVVAAPVETRQIAPTILRFLGLDPQALESVRAERTRVLPGAE